MPILQVAFSDCRGGAARAARRLHLALRASGEDSRFIARHTLPGRLAPMGALLRADTGNLLLRLQHCNDATERSAAWLPSGLAGKIGRTPHSVVNLHWLGGETLSIAQIGRLDGPVVWTLHDMWAFCGCEHYAGDGPTARWRTGYRKTNRTRHCRGADLDRWTWRRKLRHWKNPFTLITPSRWLADCVRSSQLMHDWPVHTIPNALDTDTFRPVGRMQARHQLGLPVDRKLILFAAAGGTGDPRKGFDLLEQALQKLAAAGNRQDCSCLVLGEDAPQRPAATGFPAQWLGHVGDDETLALVYSAADVLVLPSRQDNLPQSGTEAQSCGCPVVAFRTGGLPDIVDDRRTGYLAEPFDTDDLARGIAWSLEGDAHRLAHAARERAVQRWSHAAVVPAYLKAYALAQERR